jgi:beta-aspartyl-peptidase (threonine type)
MKYGIEVHGGAGSPASLSDGPEHAAETGFSFLRAGRGALEAVVEAVAVMEDDERFNAGTGSVLRFDGTAYMDAAVMTSDGSCGAVAYIREIKNPVRVAAEVMKTPHILLVADGAQEFAAKRGFGRYDNSTQRTRDRLKVASEEFRSGKRPKWPENWRNYDVDTVGAVARDGEGKFAAANSTGGTFPALKGRVGDVPMIGCGIYAGRKGAVAATGIGEEIIRKVLSKTVYDLIEGGMHPQQAAEAGIALYAEDVSVGLIAISDEGVGEAATSEMAHASRMDM